MTIPVFNLSGKDLTPIELDKKVFGAKLNPQLIAQAVRVYLSNQRSSSAHTKTRGEVQGSTRKIYKQKGTGRARHGSIRAPIFVGGGIAHGPDGTQNYKLKMPSKMVKVALLSILSQKAHSKLISAVKGSKDASGKTKEIATLISKIAPKDKILLVTEPGQTKFRLSARNIDRVLVATTSSLNVYQMTVCPNVIFTTEALVALETKYAA
ncbi:50S ribosomal protein L4 [Candidatus Amesbacteria bacterium]|nr:50S ribosomal protein L4 [Candidatus Amesbacteria bacterium]